MRWAEPDDWHVTLRFLGVADSAEVAARLDASPMPAAVARLGPAVGRLGRGFVVVPVGGLDEVAAAVQAATADLGQAPDQRPFSGHLTLARLRGKCECAAVGVPIDGEFAVSELVLVDSETKRDKAHYRVIGRWPPR